MRSTLLYLLLVTSSRFPTSISAMFRPFPFPPVARGKNLLFHFSSFLPLLLFRSECAICSSPTSKTPSPEKHIIFVLLLPRKGGGDAPPSQSAEEEEEKIFSVDRPVAELGGGGVMGERLLSSWLGGLASSVVFPPPSLDRLLLFGGGMAFCFLLLPAPCVLFVNLSYPFVPNIISFRRARGGGSERGKFAPV